MAMIAIDTASICTIFTKEVSNFSELRRSGETTACVPNYILTVNVPRTEAGASKTSLRTK